MAPPWRQRDRWATARDGRQGAVAISAPETTSPAKLWANHVFLGSRMVCISQESHSLSPATLRRHMARLVPVPSWCTWGTKRPEPGRCMRRMVCVFPAHLEAWAVWTWEVQVQAQCDPSTSSTPHSCQWCLLAVPRPLHSATEQVSLSKWPLSPPFT